MNIKMFVALTSLALLNSACSPSPENSKAASSEPAVTASTEFTTSSTTTIATATATSAIPSSNDANTPLASDLIGTHWKLILLQDTEVADTAQAPYLVLGADARLSGSDGCNKMMGSYKLAHDTLSFGELASTRMACPDDANLSGGFNQALQNTRKYSVHADQLVLQDDSGLQLARFQAVAAP